MPQDPVYPFYVRQKVPSVLRQHSSLISLMKRQHNRVRTNKTQWMICEGRNEIASYSAGGRRESSAEIERGWRLSSFHQRVYFGVRNALQRGSQSSRDNFHWRDYC